MQGAFIVSFCCTTTLCHAVVMCSVDFRCRHVIATGILVAPFTPTPVRPSWSWLLAPPSSIIDDPSDWETAPLRQGGIHATFLQISCRNIEHTRHMGWMLLFCALTSRWEEYCIIHLCQKPIYEIISAYNDESNEYIHKASELMSLQDCLWVVRILCCRKCCCGRQS